MQIHFKRFINNRSRTIDTNGVTSTRIIISPIQYTENESPEYKHFSDYMLYVATSNGEYAGRVEKNKSGFFISNKYNEEEISSAILFASGKKVAY